MGSLAAVPLIAFEAMSGIWQVVLTLLATSIVGLLVRTSFRPNTLSQIPLVGLELGNEEKRRLAYLASAKTIYQQGYEKVRQQGSYLLRISANRLSENTLTCNLSVQGWCFSHHNVKK